MNTTVEGNSVSFTDSAGVRIVETLNPDEIEAQHRWGVAAEPDLRIGSADDPTTILGRVSGIAYGQNREIIIADALTFQIKTFSIDGYPLWRQGRVGDGPGEYRDLRTVEYCGGSILVADLSSHRLTLLSTTGRIRDTEPWIPLRRGSTPFRSSCNQSGVLLQLDRVSDPPREEGPYTVPAVIGIGQVGGSRPEKVHEMPGIDRYRHATVDGPADLGKTTWVIASPNGAVVVVSDRTELRTYDARGRVVQIARWAFIPVPITSVVLRAEVAERERVLPRRRRKEYRELWLSLDHPDHLPAIDTVIPVFDGGIWAQRYQPASQRKDYSEWWRVGADGVLRGIVEVPNEFKLLRVVPGAVLGVVRDSLGVVYVEKRSIIELSQR